MLRVHSFETLGANDGPGIRSIVFLQGCPLECVYCQNPDTKDPREGTEYSTDQIVEYILKYKTYYRKNGGLTVSGGEPLLQAKGLIPVFQKIKELGYHTAIDTAGSVFGDPVKELLKYTDLVLLDVKEFDDVAHHRLTGVSNKRTLEFAKYVEEMSIPVWLRFVLMPEYTDNFDHMEAMCHHFKDYKCIERVEILPYHTMGVYKYQELGREYKAPHVRPPSKELIEKTKKLFEKYFPKVLVR